MKLNVGCGKDYRRGFINIDGQDMLSVDKVIVFPEDKLSNHYSFGSIAFIYCRDFLEHFTHWEAVELIQDFYLVLDIDKRMEILVPDVDKIVRADISTEKKITLLYGGQDIPQKNYNNVRKVYSRYFCHKYGWMEKTLTDALRKVGFNIKKVNTFGFSIKIETGED